ncbi:MAG TPA: hypothetical protein DEW35_02110 [Ruminococcaceae bacterium]|nr:hypothetical protein [Oscillospiraceae bacterium]
MIKKILMISDNDITSSESLGVTKKLLGQYKAFNNLGYDTYHLCFKDRQGVLIHGEDTAVLVKPQVKMYLTYIKLLKKADKICKKNGIDMCYIRYPLADFAFMGMIKKLHKICKVVIEIPTYPYDNENIGNVSLITKFCFSQDKRNRFKLKNFVDLVVDIGEEKSIYGIPCVNIYNSIDLDAVKFCASNNKEVRPLHIISVALIRPDHRFDRLISGLYEYYKHKDKGEPDVVFDVVGNGVNDEKEKLMDLSEKYGLKEKVIFHGVKSGTDLDSLFENSHIAVSTFNADRENAGKTSVLKTREYCARGIPFVSSLYDISIPEDSDFCKIIDSCESPVNVREIIEYYSYIIAHPDIHDRMRKFAEENLTWEKQLKKVIAAIG